VAEYRANGIIRAAVPFGLLRGELIDLGESPNELLVTSLWLDEASYGRWLDAPERGALTNGLHDLLSESGGMRVETQPLPGGLRSDEPLSPPVPRLTDYRVLQTVR
jgi:hypothetical protein